MNAMDDKIKIIIKKFDTYVYAWFYYNYDIYYTIVYILYSIYGIQNVHYLINSTHDPASIIYKCRDNIL